MYLVPEVCTGTVGPKGAVVSKNGLFEETIQ